MFSKERLSSLRIVTKCRDRSARFDSMRLIESRRVTDPFFLKFNLVLRFFSINPASQEVGFFLMKLIVEEPLL